MNPISYKIPLTLVWGLFVLCGAFDDVCVDVNDILSPRWMPGTILENIRGADDYGMTINNTSSSVSRELDGSISDALSTMTFHRSMVNQYLCRNYLASQILEQIAKTSFQKRMDEADLGLSDAKKKLKQNILFDPGSSSYEEWLRKSATLDDIYRHHNKINELSEDIKVSKSDMMEDIGHAPSISTKYDPEVPDMSDYIHETDHYSHPYYHQHAYYAQPTYVYHSPQDEKGHKKSEKLGDLFEIALTALTFLSFGMFIVHLIMSISAVTNHPASTMNPGIFGLNPAALMNSDSIESDSIATESISFESEEDKFRDIKGSSNTYIDVLTLNQIAKTFLNVWDSALTADKDGGYCLKKALCNASRYSRFVKGRTKLFMGLCSFGLSWLSEYLSNKAVSRMESLQATVFGLGLSNCDEMYRKCYVNA